MTGAPLSLILDVVILVLLGLTIVYAARLSLQLRRLRDSKSDLDKIVKDLIKNIDRADRSIQALKDEAKTTGTDLQRAIGNAVSLADELQLMTESGDRLAGRLEKLVDGVKPLTSDIQAREQALGDRAEAVHKAPKQTRAEPATVQSSYTDHLRKLDVVEEKATDGRNAGGPFFAIRDPEVERGIDPVAQTEADEAALYSQAERDLFKAMKGRASR
ncbi:MAG TPA: DUF6468 domain-containing protein [Alphaproteobacteria bacterium]